MAAFQQPISLVCAGAPAAATCTVNPSSVTPLNTALVPVNVSVTTTARGVVTPFSRRLRWQPLVWMCTSLLVLAFCLVNATSLRRQVVAATLIILFFFRLVSRLRRRKFGKGHLLRAEAHHLVLTA